MLVEYLPRVGGVSGILRTGFFFIFAEEGFIICMTLTMCQWHRKIKLIKKAPAVLLTTKQSNSEMVPVPVVEFIYMPNQGCI